MMESQVIQFNPIFLDAHQALRDICRDFLLQHRLSYFAYLRVNQENLGFFVSTHPQWLAHYMEHDFLLTREELDNLTSYGFLSHTLPLPQGILKSKKRIQRLLNDRIFDIYHCFYLVNRTASHTEILIFGIDHDDASMLQYYINHIDDFVKFENFFKHQAASLIQQFEKQQCVILNDTKLVHHASPSSVFGMDEVTIINELGDIVALSQREAQCFVFFAQGHQAKEIAHLCGLSPRTVDKHIYNIKEKIKCHTRAQLRDIMLCNYHNWPDFSFSIVL